MVLLSRSLGSSICVLLLVCTHVFAQDQPLILGDLINEALENNPEILSAKDQASALWQKVPQEGALPDPMLTIGYQNEGFKKYTYSDSPDSQWMYSASQTFPFPGKRSLKEDAATYEARSSDALRESVRLKIISELTEAYFDLFLVYKNLDLFKERLPLLEQIEQVALSRYASGIGSMEDALMAQTQKYMLMEKQEMQKQTQETLNARINRYLGRDAASPVGRPVEIVPTVYEHSLEELLDSVPSTSPELISRNEVVSASEKRLMMARKESWPDFTISATYSDRSSSYDDMWALSAGINLPIFYNRKQKPGIEEASWNLSLAKHEAEAVRLALSADIKENYAMMQSAGKLMTLYKNGLIPKTRQDIDNAFAQYSSGKLDANTILSKLSATLEYELFYWQQYGQREKAISRLNAITGLKGDDEEEEEK